MQRRLHLHRQRQPAVDQNSGLSNGASNVSLLSRAHGDKARIFTMGQFTKPRSHGRLSAASTANVARRTPTISVPTFTTTPAASRRRRSPRQPLSSPSLVIIRDRQIVKMRRISPGTSALEWFRAGARRQYRRQQITCSRRWPGELVFDSDD